MRKREKHRIYKKVLNKFINDLNIEVQRRKYNNGINPSIDFPNICVYLDTFSGGEEDCKNLFPEFFKYKPRRKRTESSWWSNSKRGWNKRIEVLKKCIEETK